MSENTDQEEVVELTEEQKQELIKRKKEEFIDSTSDC